MITTNSKHQCTKVGWEINAKRIMTEQEVTAETPSEEPKKEVQQVDSHEAEKQEEDNMELGTEDNEPEDDVKNPKEKREREEEDDEEEIKEVEEIHGDGENEKKPAASDDGNKEGNENDEPTIDAPALPLRPIKRARTGYFIFADEKRAEVQAKVRNGTLQ
jgi:hypothetical protein